MNDAELSRQLDLVDANIKAQHAKVQLREAHYAHEDAMERVDQLRRELEDAEAEIEQKAEEVEVPMTSTGSPRLASTRRWRP